jgi:hypothetical protein
MKIKYLLIFSTLFVIFHLACHFFNLYFKIWWTDIVAHFIAGFTAGLFWWYLLERIFDLALIRNYKFFSLTIITFATSISTFWEFWEFSNWGFAILRDTIGQIQQQFYPHVGNNLGDIFWGLVGGCLASSIFLWSYRANTKTENKKQ